MNTAQVFAKDNFRVNVVYYLDCLEDRVVLYIEGIGGKFRHKVREYTTEELRRVYESYPLRHWPEHENSVMIDHFNRHAEMAWPTN